MATQKISEMTETIVLQDEDYVPIVQSGLNRKIKIEYLRDYNKLHNKPTLNGVTIENNKKLSDYNVVKANQGIKVNSGTNQTLELEVPTNQELEQRLDVNKAITIATADKMAKETAHQTMSKEYQPNSQDNLTEGENQPVSYKAVKTYVDLLESKVDTNESDIESKHTTLNNKVDKNERDIEDKVQKLDEKTAAKDSELESLITTNEQDIEQKYTTLNQKVEQNKQTTDNEIQQLKSKDSELENLISTNEEDIESKVQELDNKKLNKEETPKTLPNPNKLTFTGAVSGEYDGSEPVTIQIPQGGSGGGSGENLIVQYTVLASGIIPKGQTEVNSESHIDTGITLGDLKQYKYFIIRQRLDDSRPYLIADINNIRLGYGASNAMFLFCEFEGLEKNIIKILGGFGNSAQSNPNDAFVNYDLSTISTTGCTSPIKGIVNLSNTSNEKHLKIGIGHMNGLESTKFDLKYDVCGVIKYV